MATTLYDIVAIKLQLGEETRRLKLPLKDLTPSTLPTKLRGFLMIPSSKNVVFERYSDSAGTYVTLDPANQSVYKQLYRAAKAKAKLRIKVIVTDLEETKQVPVAYNEEAKPISIIKSPVMPASPSSAQLPIPSTQSTRIMNSMSKPSQETLVKEEAVASLAPLLKSWTGHLTSFTVQCNNCGDTIPGTHFHCNICDNNDFDLCSKCVESGVHCEVEKHYLIKRSVVDGKVQNSTSTILPKKPVLAPFEVEKKMPGTFETQIKEPFVDNEATRTCNSCVTSFPENKFITCLDCEDYDLCDVCFNGNRHGHHPVHSFKPVDESNSSSFQVTNRGTAENGFRHLASCDGCDMDIRGARHKCLSCPDWDYCTTCYLSAQHIHPGHRFVPIYEHIGMASGLKPTHNFIRCDGPLCKTKNGYIRGDRYKCAVCNDTDFCASCEALPTNTHCRTHPLIKIRTPVRNISVTTFGEDVKGAITNTMGDRPPQHISRSTEMSPSKSANAATQVQTIAEIKPVPKVEPVAESVKEELPADPKLVSPPASPVAKPQLQAHFVQDTITDGSKLLPNKVYTQVWTLRNPGPLVWPAGCSVRYTGGDNMLNINTEKPASTKDIEAAVSSNSSTVDIQAGEELRFEVSIKTPKLPGRAVSYWRLKTPQGLPFGHKLWCDVEIVLEEPKVVEPKREANLEGSQMVFPTLEKESPASSILVTEPAKDSTPAVDEDVEFLDDLEHLSIGADDDSEDAFLTDEEYEMLDTESIPEEATNGKRL